MKIARIFFDSDMRQGFQGMHGVLQKAKVDHRNLDPADFYIFMNHARTKFKLLSGQYLVYFNNGNRRIPLEAIQYLPSNFGGSQLDLERAMTNALRTSLLKQLGQL